MLFKTRANHYSSYLFVLLPLILLYLAAAADGQESMAPKAAPINPEFLRFQEGLAAGRSLFLAGRSEEDLGLIPSPLDLSHLRRQVSMEPRSAALGLPANYDLRGEGRVTAVRNQLNCGSCWAFAAYGSLESNLMVSETDDFSENHLKNTHGFDWKPCGGGNGDIAAAYLARWGGAVSERDDPYRPSSRPSRPGLKPVKHIQEVVILPGRRDSLDNDDIKQAVMAHGGVYTPIYWSNSYYASENYAYYGNDTNKINHAVVIVGWDDHYPKENFPAAPPGDGAFIVRNSWGPRWGEKGYFYLSYYDTSMVRESYVFDNAEPVANYDRIYQYDPLGWTSSLGYDSDTAWFSNVFSAVEDEKLRAVSFFSASLNSAYGIYVYKDVTSGPTTGVLAGSETGTLAFPGYHTINLSSSIRLTSGRKFSVVVKLTTPGFNYPIPLEEPFPNYSSRAKANAGESYASSDGVSWEDVAVSYPNTNACLKAFTSSTMVSGLLKNAQMQSSRDAFHLPEAGYPESGIAMNKERLPATPPRQ